MTFILAVRGRKSIWLLADRRLSYEGRLPKDDTCKVIFVETTDGVAILGYAGLGATARGTEPSDWMSAVLRGTSFSLEQSLGALAEAMKRQFPPHMVGMLGDGGPSHTVLVPAFLGREPRLYTIGLALTPDRKSYASGCIRMVNRMPLDTSRPPPIVMTGSGALPLSTEGPDVEA